jgi:hypothetical protein
MPATAVPRSLVAVVTATLALVVPLAVDVAVGQGAADAGTTPAMIDTTSHLGHACTAAPGYGWPVRPFHRPHAIRGSFGDPRVGLASTGVGLSYSFHTGVDVVAADGTPVYATLTGGVSLDPKYPDVVWVDDGRGTMFSYWHVVPAVRAGDRVVAYQTIVGHVEQPWGHVHFSEIRGGAFVNPLRAGAMGPYIDHTPPEITAVTLEHHARPVPLGAAHGSLDVIVQVDDPPAHAIAAPWTGLPVVPATVRWRITGPHGAGTRWATALDLSHTIPSNASYDRVFAQWTRQNHPNQRGRYRVYLSHALQTAALPSGEYRVEIAASDLCGNRSTASAQLTLGHGAGL